jgi:hypothetical protein
VLSHGNLIADAAGTCALLDDWQPGDRHISYLPLAHIYERNNMTVSVHLGGSVGFYSGNVQELLDDVLVRALFTCERSWNLQVVCDCVRDRVRPGGSAYAAGWLSGAYG